ncbi:MAG: PAS domain S-box protein [Deltaproteobacteria bacterium]|nr:MAG: PAS domain S-box protein [Deltaproteobacteria bacterium]
MNTKWTKQQASDQAEWVLDNVQDLLTLSEQASQVGCWSWEVGTEVVKWSDGLFRVLGRDPSQGTPTPEQYMERVHPLDRERVEAIVKNSFEGDSYEITYRFFRYNDGQERWVHSIGEVSLDDNGKPDQMWGTKRDITEQRLLEEQLEHEHTHLKLAIDMLNLGLWRVDNHTGKTHWSHVTHRLFGTQPTLYTPTLRRWFQSVHPDDKNAAKELIRNAQEGLPFTNAHIRFQLSNMEERYYVLSGRPQLDSKQNVTGFYGIILDETEERFRENDLRSSEEKYRTLFDLANDAILTIERPNATIVESNVAAQHLLGYTAESLQGLSTEQLIPAELLEEASTIAQKQLQNTGSFVLETQWLHSNGSTIDVSVSGRPIRIDKMDYFLLIGRDIREKKREEANLRDSISELSTLKTRLETENVYLKDEIKTKHDFTQLVGDSSKLKAALHKVELVAQTDTTVLILGETGTGKELIAHSIHELSQRSDRPLVKVNCATLPANLIESELFGHERGAFTSAYQQRIGRFELANQGTIFLDEIGDLPLHLQAKLLRVLQEGTFERLGGQGTQHVNVRVIAATNHNLLAQVHEGKFREDLYFRLNVFPVQLPPLRERPNDIDQLVWHFIALNNKKMNKQIQQVSSTTMEKLRNYNWPGNIRELENVIERAMILSPGSELELHEPLLQQPGLFSGTGLSGQSFVSLAEFEKQYILQILEHTGWVVSGERGAAKILDMKPTTLEARMKKLGIQRPQ